MFVAGSRFVGQLVDLTALVEDWSRLSVSELVVDREFPASENNSWRLEVVWAASW